MRTYSHYNLVGELTTWIDVQAPISEVSATGYPSQSWESIWGGSLRPCRWINAHGSEAWQNASLDLKEAATIMLRYDPGIAPECRVIKGGETWEIISLDDVRERGHWLELKIKRIVPAQ